MIINTKDLYLARVLRKYEARAEAGLEKYGTTLERKDLTGEDWLNHLQEELMDATLYLERLKDDIRRIKSYDDENTLHSKTRRE